MAKSKQQKEEAVQKIRDGFANAKSTIFLGFDRLSVNAAGELRAKCAAEGVEYMVAKKTLINLAAKEADLDIDAKGFEGQIGVAFGTVDEVAAAKVLHEFGGGRESFALLGGILEGKVIDAAGAVALAKLPSRDELLAKMVGSINAPVSGFVNTLAGVTRGFVQVLDQIAQSKK